MDTEFWPDYLNSEAVQDENTIITDYWLDFVAAREEKGEPAEVHILGTNLQGTVQELPAGTSAPAETRSRRRAKLDMFAREAQFFPLTAGTGKSMEPASERAGRIHKPGADDPSTPRTLSLADRLRNSFFYTTIQKLR